MNRGISSDALGSGVSASSSWQGASSYAAAPKAAFASGAAAASTLGGSQICVTPPDFRFSLPVTPPELRQPPTPPEAAEASQHDTPPGAASATPLGAAAASEPSQSPGAASASPPGVEPRLPGYSYGWLSTHGKGYRKSPKGQQELSGKPVVSKDGKTVEVRWEDGDSWRVPHLIPEDMPQDGSEGNTSIPKPRERKPKAKGAPKAFATTEDKFELMPWRVGPSPQSTTKDGKKETKWIVKLTLWVEEERQWRQRCQVNVDERHGITKIVGKNMMASIAIAHTIKSFDHKLFFPVRDKLLGLFMYIGEKFEAPIEPQRVMEFVKDISQDARRACSS